MGKSAQFPLHVWLPDAMEGPTPVSALIHAATMVVAGVFLVARIFPLFVLSPDAMLVVAIIGLATALIAAAMALVMTDLKRVLAYSTISHLGFMMLALGAGGYTAAIFHLLAHAFAKALLFLGAGSVTHGTDKTDIRDMGGLRSKMPLTFITFAIGSLALAGIPPLGGFFSKDEILVAVLDGRQSRILPADPGRRAPERAVHGPGLPHGLLRRLKEDNEHAHESPLLMVLPLAVLAALALTAGLLAPGWTSDYQGFGAWLFFDEPHPYKVNVLVMALSIVLAVGGFALGWAMYGRGVVSQGANRGRRRGAQGRDEPAYDRHPIPARLQEQFSGLHALVVNKFYIDDMYQWGIDRVALAFANFMALFDRIVVNDTGVNGTGNSVRLSGWVLRYIETGKVYNYALGMALGVVVIALIWWLAIPNV